VTEDPAVNIVHICTPNHLHKDALLSAMRHQKHIYCDKPLTATMAEAEQVRAALPEYRGVAQMTFQNRFYAATLRARQLVDEGFLGQLLQFRAAYLHGSSADPNAPLKWKLTTAAGGGVIADLATHVLDLVEHLLGPIRSVLGETHIAFPRRPSPSNAAQRLPVDAEDAVTVIVRLANGALGVIEATKLAAGSEDELRLEAHGSGGAIRFNGMDPHHLEVYRAAEADRPLGGMRGWTRIDCGARYLPPDTQFPTPKAAVGWLRIPVACLANFLQCVAAGKPAEPGLEQGIRVQRLMECIRTSAAQRRWVDVP
jgi:predicted dehydrogenase